MGPGGSTTTARHTTVLGALRALGLVTALVTSLPAAMMVAEGTWGFVVALLSLGLLWAAYLGWSWSREEALLLPLSLWFCLLIFGLFAENLLRFERLLHFRISNKLVLSPRLTQWAAMHAATRTNTWEQFGSNPLFFRRQPGSTYRDRYDHRNYGKEYEAIADALGYLNPEHDFYNQHATIDMFITGGSVMEGVGLPGVIEELKALPMSVFSLAMGSYSPRQKAEALQIFGIPKHPKWLVLEFHGGTDAATAIEDDVCEKMQRDYTCRFDFPLIGSGLSKDKTYATLGWFGDFSAVMQSIRRIRSDSMTLALGTGLALYFRRFVQETPFSQQIVRLNGEAISLPGFAHYSLYPERHLEWVRTGVTLALQAYDSLVERSRQAGAKVMILYNPTSYEIYRDVLSTHDTSALSDAIATYQRETLATYAGEKKVAFCDLTAGLQQEARAGKRGLFGHHDGTHWSEEGRKTAGEAIVACIKTHAQSGSSD
jgi:lysophospholipase L1-like esterase